MNNQSVSSESVSSDKWEKVVNKSKSPKIDKTQYKKDLTFGLKNEKLSFKHIRKFLKEYLKEDIKIIKFNNPKSIFDFKVLGKPYYIELKSRRNDINKYDTQLIGANKVRYGRTLKEKNKDTKIFYFYLLEEEFLGKTIKKLYMFLDNNEELKIKHCGNYKRNDKTSELMLIQNKQLHYCASFEGLTISS